MVSTDDISEAIINNDIIFIKKYVHPGFDLYKNNKDMIYLALNNHRFEIFEYLITLGADINADQGKFLCETITNKDWELFEMVFCAGVKPGEYTEQILQTLIYQDNLSIFKLFMEDKELINSTYLNTQALLFEAINYSDDIFMYLINNGNKWTQFIKCQLIRASYKHGKTNIIEYIYNYEPHKNDALEAFLWFAPNEIKIKVILLGAHAEGYIVDKKVLAEAVCQDVKNNGVSQKHFYNAGLVVYPDLLKIVMDRDSRKEQFKAGLRAAPSDVTVIF